VASSEATISWRHWSSNQVASSEATISWRQWSSNQIVSSEAASSWRVLALSRGWIWGRCLVGIGVSGVIGSWVGLGTGVTGVRWHGLDVLQRAIVWVCCCTFIVYSSILYFKFWYFYETIYYVVFIYMFMVSNYPVDAHDCLWFLIALWMDAHDSGCRSYWRARKNSPVIFPWVIKYFKFHKCVFLFNICLFFDAFAFFEVYFGFLSVKGFMDLVYLMESVKSLIVGLMISLTYSVKSIYNSIAFIWGLRNVLSCYSTVRNLDKLCRIFSVQNLKNSAYWIWIRFKITAPLLDSKSWLYFNISKSKNF